MEEKITFIAKFKEWGRKNIVNLKRKPQLIPTLFIAIAMIIFTMSLQTYARAVITNGGFGFQSDLTGQSESIGNGIGMVYFFCVLFSFLSLISFITAFPRREKPKYLSIGVTLFMLAAQIGCQIYMIAVLNYDFIHNQAAKYDINNPDKVAAIQNLSKTINTGYVHIVFLVISIVLICLIPVIKKLLNKINTSVNLEVTEVEAIEVSEDE